MSPSFVHSISSFLLSLSHTRSSPSFYLFLFSLFICSPLLVSSLPHPCALCSQLVLGCLLTPSPWIHNGLRTPDKWFVCLCALVCVSVCVRFSVCVCSFPGWDQPEAVPHSLPWGPEEHGEECAEPGGQGASSAGHGQVLLWHQHGAPQHRQIRAAMAHAPQRGTAQQQGVTQTGSSGSLRQELVAHSDRQQGLTQTGSSWSLRQEAVASDCRCFSLASL